METTIDARFLHDLSVVAEDETMLAKVTKYVRKLAKQMTDDSTRMTKEEFYARVDEAEREIAKGNGRTFTTKTEMHTWLNAL